MATPEADTDIPTPVSSANETRDATKWPSAAMLGVFSVIGVVKTAQNMGSADPNETLGYRIGFGSVDAIIILVALAVFLSFVSGVYYFTSRKNGTTFKEALFNWPMVVLTAGIAAFTLPA